jgi:hypothetical protein
MCRKIATTITRNIYRDNNNNDYLWRRQNNSECRKCVVKKLLVHLWVEVTDEDVGPDIQVLLMGRSFVDPDGLSVELDHVHDLDGVVGVVLAQELYEPVALDLSLRLGFVSVRLA